jgi:4-diphosphocytidyl-2-C-methyl-D-erythritol kinase
MKIEAYAKVNLTLEVLGRRVDGYHDLRSVVAPVSLSDSLEVEIDGELSSDSGFADDLCLKAATTLAQACPAGLGARIHVEKRIPAGGGLGGGSADAAATLRALNALWGLGKSDEELAEIAADVGSDVPALVLGGMVVMEGRGERVRRLDFRPPTLDLVLVNPGVFSSTREVYGAVDGSLHQRPKILYNMLQALRRGRYEEIASATFNDLQTPATALHGEIASALYALKAAGAEGTTVSGSGSTVFGLVPDAARGREIAAQLEAKGYWARSVRTIVR